MPTEQFDIGAFIKLDGESQFKSAVTNVNNSMKGMKAELARVKEEYAGNLNSLEALSKKQEIFGRLQTELANKIERIKEGQRNASTVLEEYTRKVQTMETKLEEARNRLNEMRESGEHSADAIAAQEAEIERLGNGLNRANENLARQQARVSGWEASLRRAEAEQARLNNQVNENSRYLEEARHSTDRHAHSIDGNARAVRQSTEVIIEWGEALKTAVADKAIDAGIDAVKQLGSAAADSALEMQKAENQIEASMDASGAALEKYKDAIADIYGNNYGDSLEDVGEAIASAARVLGELDGTELQDVVESAFALQDTFGMDMDETLRGVKSLMYQFGMTAGEAMDLVGSGARKGLNYTDELGDNLSEYAGKFSQAGYSAQEYFQLLENGTSNGAYNLDKVNDAINEVTTRLADGTVEDSLGMYSEGTRTLFREWQQGGAAQKQVIDSIVSDIAGCQNQQEALNMAAQAFGTMAEDGNLQFISSLTSVGNAFDDVQGKMDEIKETKYDDLNSQITGISRTIQMQLGKQIERLLPIAVNGLENVSENLEIVETGIIGIGTAIAVNKLFKAEFFRAAISGIMQLVASIRAWGLASTLAAVKTQILNAVMSISPWTIFAGAIGAAVAAVTAFILIYQKAAKSTNAVISESQEAYEELSARIDENREAREKNVGSAAEEYSACKSLVSQLYAMTDAERMSSEGKAKAGAMVATLNEKFEGLNLRLDETTGKLNMEKDALDALADSMEKQAMAEAAQDALKEVASERIELMRQRQEAIDTVNDLSAEHAAGNGAVQAAVSKQMREQQEVIQGLNGQLDKNAEEFDQLSGIAGEYVDAAESATEATEDYAETADGVQASSETQQEALESLREKYQEIRDSIAEAAANKIDMFSAFDGGDESGLDEIEKNLASQADGLEKWTANMEKLADEVGDTITPELYQHLVELGPDAANAVNEMAEALDSDSGKERLKKIAEEYGRALDASGTAGDALANMSATIQMMLGEMSDAAALDYSALEESLEGAAEAAASGGEEITEAEKSAFLEMVDAAREIGADIPDGLAEGVASGETSVAEAISQLKGSIQGQYDFLAEMAASAGIKIPENIQEGINQGGEAAVNAIQELQALLIGKQGEAEKSYEASGKSSTEATAKGIESGKGNVTSATGNVMQSAADKGNEYKGQFENVGGNMMLGVAAGMNRNSIFISNAVKKIMQGAVDTANSYNKTNSPSKLWRDKVGGPIAEGLALGIRNGQKDAMSASADLAKAAVQGTQDELDIHSPSGLFKKLGKYISQGLGVGILDGKKYAAAQSKKMAKEVYEVSAEWMEAYQKEHSVSLGQEKKFWQELAKVVKKDSASYKQARKNAAENDGFTREVRKNTEKAFGVSWYTAKAKKTVKKDADGYYNELTKAAKKYIENKKATDDVSLQQEKYFWEQVKKSAGKGTQTYADASKKIKEINKSIKKELSSGETRADRIEYGVSGSALDLYKSLYKVSAKAEWEYWKQVRKSAGLTAEQKLEIDGKILEAKQNYYDQLGELEDEYYEKCRDINDKLKEDVEDATKEYTDALADRKSAIKGSFGLFDEFTSEAEAPETLLANMQSQAAGYALWMEQLEELEAKQILGGPFLEELRQMGPEAAATVLSLNMMTDEQLRLANEAYEEKDRLAAAQAGKELESLRAETEKKIQELEKAAQAELNEYKKEYEKASAELSEAIAEPLQNLAEQATALGEEATAKLILGLKSTAESKETKKELKGIQQKIADGMAKLPDKGKGIGKDTLAGILSGLGDKLKIQKGAKSFVEELEAAIKKEAGIASPSKRFRDAVGRQIPAGVAQGVEAGTPQAASSGADMVNAMLEQSAEQARQRQAALADCMAGINGSAGIAALNSLTAAPAQQAANVTVDNTGVAEMVGGMTAEIRALREEMKHMKIMLDKETLVGELAGPIGDELAMQMMRWQ